MSVATSDLQFQLVDTDVLVEAVLSARDPRRRAAIVAAVVQDLCAAVEWVHAEAPVADGCAVVELDGVHQLGSAAQRHSLRMSMAAVPVRET